MLDEELNKVNQFYKSKEAEFLERGEILNKQLQILLDLKRVIGERRRKSFGGQSGGFLSRSGSSFGRNSDLSGELLCLDLYFGTNMSQNIALEILYVVHFFSSISKFIRVVSFFFHFGFQFLILLQIL